MSWTSEHENTPRSGFSAPGPPAFGIKYAVILGNCKAQSQTTTNIMAAIAVFGTAELLEYIILNISPRDIVLAASVGAQWKDTIEGSKKIRDKLTAASETNGRCLRQLISYFSTPGAFHNAQKPGPLTPLTYFDSNNDAGQSVSRDLPWGRILLIRRYGIEYAAVLRKDSTGQVVCLKVVDGHDYKLEWQRRECTVWRVRVIDRVAETCDYSDLGDLSRTGFDRTYKQRSTISTYIPEEDEGTLRYVRDPFSDRRRCMWEFHAYLAEHYSVKGDHDCLVEYCLGSANASL